MNWVLRTTPKRPTKIYQVLFAICVDGVLQTLQGWPKNINNGLNGYVRNVIRYLRISFWIFYLKTNENNKIVKVLNQQICLAGCTDSSAWPHCKWAMDNGGCHGPWLSGGQYTYGYADTMKSYCRGSCPEFCRKLLPACIFREGRLDLIN